MNDLAHQTWEDVYFFADNPNSMWDIWKGLFLEILDKHAPLKRTKVKSKRSPWLTSSIKAMIHMRDKLKRKAMITKIETDWENYKKMRNDTTLQIRQAKQEYFSNKIKNESQNPKSAWKTINSLLGKQNKITNVNELIIDDKKVTSPSDIAESFNEYFSEIGPKLADNIDQNNSNCFQQYIKKAESEFATFEPVTVNHVFHLLSKLQSTKATGIDKISSKIIKIAAPIISNSLTHIFNQSITLCSFPNEWKIAKVTPIFKSGKKNLPENYRPISVLPILSKIMERILYNQLCEYLTKNNLLSEKQFGFRKHHSTATALLDCTNSWYLNMDRKMFNLVVLIDLKKAFDTVDHQILLKKMEHYGIKGDALTLLTSYLSARTQKCQVNGFVSSERDIKCGVPQGSILGPLFFLIYINDLPTCLNKTEARLFADDTNITAAGKTLNEVENAVNSDLENLQNWLIANKLSLNVTKTEFILIGSNQILKIGSNCQPNISIDGKPVKQVTESKTLGIVVDKNLNWRSNTDNVCKKITSGLGALRRVKEFVDRKTLLSIYNAIIQPYFDYCCEVWNVLGETQSTRLQKLHNRAARIITNMPNEVHQDTVLNELNWEPLKLQRIKAKAKIMYKVLNNMGPECLQNQFTFREEVLNHNLRNSDLNVCLPKPRTNNMKKSFLYDGGSIWNSLSIETKNSKSLNQFKRNIAASV